VAVIFYRPSMGDFVFHGAVELAAILNLPATILRLKNVMLGELGHLHVQLWGERISRPEEEFRGAS